MLLSEQELTKEIERLVAAVTYQKQRIAELEQKVALSTPGSAEIRGRGTTGAASSRTGNGSATSKGSSSSGSTHSGQTTVSCFIHFKRRFHFVNFHISSHFLHFHRGIAAHLLLLFSQAHY